MAPMVTGAPAAERPTAHWLRGKTVSLAVARGLGYEQATARNIEGKAADLLSNFSVPSRQNWQSEEEFRARREVAAHRSRHQL